MKILRLLCALLSALLITSCSTDTAEPDELEVLTYGIAPLPLRSSQTEPGSEEMNENTITDLKCYLGDREGQRFTLLPIRKSSPGRLLIDKKILRERMIPGISYRLHLLANVDGRLTLPTESTGESLRSMTLRMQEMMEKNGRSAPESLPMYGTAVVTLDPSSKVLGHVTLRRHLSKIRVTVIYKDQQMQRYGVYTTDGRRDPFWGVPEVKALGLSVTAPLLPEGDGAAPRSETDQPTEYIPMSQSRTLPDLPEGSTHPYPIYSGPLAWNADDLERPRLLLKIPLYVGEHPETASHDEATYFYYTCTVVRPSSETGKSQRLLPNTLYDIVINIDELGSTEEQHPKPIAEKVVVRPWSEEHKVDIDVDHKAYLQITPITSDMYGDHKVFLFSSSSPLRSVTGVSSHRRYNGTTGAALPTESTSLTPFISFTAGRREGEIRLDRPRPSLEVPHYYSITVTSEEGIERKLSVTHYPDVIVTEIKSADQTAMTNPNMYIFTLPQHTGTEQYKVGYPSREHPTKEDSELISPHFMISSWNHGDFSLYRYRDAQTRATSYTETDFLGNEYKGWRLPTKAEIKLINQVSQKSAGVTDGQSILYKGALYWSLHEDNTSGLKSVRLIYDLP